MLVPLECTSQVGEFLGRKDANKSAVTIRDVAKASGFSASTVSIVLNNAPLARYIPLPTKTRIQKAAKSLGYHPNIFAKSLRSKRNHTVGVILFDITDPYCTPILRGIENTLYQASYLPILTDAHNERSRFERYLEMLLERRVEALIILANWLFLDINVLGDLEKPEIPTVIIGRELQSNFISSV
ncbi:MAG TPA: LacI family DNA-binding transcriptional regulator, partial [Candidatus Sulfotelmatobacter sp.]|nr:LacI family DNA-binding transcriptional regulator [Candidatus Sulfotelmatobacter sp.]